MDEKLILMIFFMKVVSLEERNGKTLDLFVSSRYLFLIKVLFLF